MSKLDEIALNIELVLISIIEGVALVQLSEHSIPLLERVESALLYGPYILAGLAILLVFWAQAILHAVSFIRWPLRMEHMLLYFVAGFLQVIAYSAITEPVAWFFWWSMFSLLAIWIYVVDLGIIEHSTHKFKELPGGEAYTQELTRRHMFELTYLVPAALAFNLTALALVYLKPELFEKPWLLGGLGALQFAVSLGALYDCIKNFKARSFVLPQLFR